MASKVDTDRYSLAVGRQELRAYVESLPHTDPDRLVMISLLALPGTRPMARFNIGHELGGGSLLDEPLTKGCVRAMLVQSRRQKNIYDTARYGQGQNMEHNDDDGPCEGLCIYGLRHGFAHAIRQVLLLTA